jgi:hypothetical protein
LNLAKRKRIEIKTVDYEVINMSEPHVYLVREMSLGKVLEQVKTSDIEVARKAYNKNFPPSESKAPSLRVDGKELLWDCEVYLMQADGDRQVPIKPRTGKKPPREIGRGAYAVQRKHSNKEILYINSVASRYLAGAKRARIELDEGEKEIRVIWSEDGNKLIKSGSGREISSMAALGGADIDVGVRWPVEPCKGGIRIRYGVGEYHESAG